MVADALTIRPGRDEISHHDAYVVVTTILQPTRGVKKLAAEGGFQLVVAGDRKTPPGWSNPNTVYLSPHRQRQLECRVARALPWNHYSRKLVGYVYAVRRGARLIIDTDDDNIPKRRWRFPAFDGWYENTQVGLGFVNIYTAFTAAHIWPRGFPLERVLDPHARVDGVGLSSRYVKVGVWQGLADGEPDVDAVYRLTINHPRRFRTRPPIVLAPGTLCPFNSQNTAFRREVFALLYLPAFVTFRFTDILRGLVAQPILWAAGYRVGFTAATVVQERNLHNHLMDFESEIPCYLLAQRVVDVVGDAVRKSRSIPDNLVSAYEALRRARIVQPREMKVLNAWLRDVEG